MPWPDLRWYRFVFVAFFVLFTAPLLARSLLLFLLILLILLLLMLLLLLLL
jgi:hypothetical protein